MLGKRHWIIPEGYIPAPGSQIDLAGRSHEEAACVVNAGGEDVNLKLTLYFTDRDPVGPYCISVPAKRTVHLRFDELKDPEPVPRESDYASVIEASHPVVIQHARLGSASVNHQVRP